LALRLKNKYTIPSIVESLNKALGGRLKENWYVFVHADEITKTINKMLGVDLSRKYLRLVEIKKTGNHEKNLIWKQFLVIS